MNKWIVPLEGYNRDFQHLPALFDAPRLRVVRTMKDGEEIFDMESTEFDSCSSWEGVHSHAVNLLAVINGTARIKISGFGCLRLWKYIVGIEEDGTEKRFSIPDPNEQGEVKSCQLSPDYSEAREWLAKIPENPEIGTALTIYSFADTWVGLYLVLDFIQEDVGGQKALP